MYYWTKSGKQKYCASPFLQERASYLEYQKVMREVEHLTRLYVAHQFVMAEVCFAVHAFL